MKIGGFQKVSLIDYPGKICAIIFTQGCNFRCFYCHNPELVDPKRYSPPIPEEEVLSFLEKRKNKLDAVEITGGEPTLHPDLIDFIKKIKSMGFLVKLDSNGSNPKKLEEALKYVDFVAMDIKAPLEKYSSVVGVKIDTEKIKKSTDLIIHSNKDYEFRTTLIKGFHSVEDVISMGELINGARLYVLQRFVKSKILDEPRCQHIEEYSPDELNMLKNEMERYVEKVHIR